MKRRTVSGVAMLNACSRCPLSQRLDLKIVWQARNFAGMCKSMYVRIRWCRVQYTTHCTYAKNAQRYKWQINAHCDKAYTRLSFFCLFPSSADSKYIYIAVLCCVYTQFTLTEISILCYFNRRSTHGFSLFSIRISFLFFFFLVHSSTNFVMRLWVDCMDSRIQTEMIHRSNDVGGSASTGIDFFASQMREYDSFSSFLARRRHSQWKVRLAQINFVKKKFVHRGAHSKLLLEWPQLHEIRLPSIFVNFAARTSWKRAKAST